jgi:4a-hydroxytetrahydrobiopterin dehydratase
MDIPDGWTESADGKALERSYRFKDFSEAFAFLARDSIDPPPRHALQRLG